jgi:TPR repeat protein
MPKTIKMLLTPAGISRFTNQADEGDPPAAHVAGYMYAEGINTAADIDAAAVYYRKASDGGIVGAQADLGFSFEDVGNDLAAVDEFEGAAYRWHAGAAFHIGGMHEFAGTLEDAWAWYKLAEDAGHTTGAAQADALNLDAAALTSATAKLEALRAQRA